MKVPFWLHQFDNGYPGLVGSDDSKLPISEVLGKTNDGTRWQSTWDAHAAAIGGLSQVARVEREIYRPQGIGYTPWGVVAGRSVALGVNQGPAEGALLGQIARAAAYGGERPVFVVDLEPHYHGGDSPQFWRDDLGANGDDVRRLIAAYELAAPGGELWVAPDARDPHLAPVSFGAWVAADAVTRCLPQVYFTDFNRPRVATLDDAERALDAAISTLAAWGWRTRATIHPILPADAQPEALVGAIRYAHELGCGGVSIWQRGNLTPENAKALLELADPWGGPTVEAPLTAAEIRAVRRLIAAAGGA